MITAGYARGAGQVAFLFVALASCTSPTPPSGTTSTASASSAAPDAAPADTATQAEGRASDDIKPVYPETKDPPDPLAQRYCDLVYELAEKKRKECCPDLAFSAFRPTGECVRTLSYALRSKAVTLETAAVDACEAALLEEAKRCDWGGAIPAACEGIVRGHLDENALCRSSLECKDGLFCGGLGATNPGKCKRPEPVGARCGITIDTLGAFIRQDAEREHPQCDGYCERRRCAATVAPGGECKSSLQCGKDRRCSGGKCTDAALPAAGKPCDQKACEKGLVCVKGTCVTQRRLGETCGSDEECRSTHCERADGGEAKCAMSCRIIPQPAGSGAQPVKKR